MGVEREHDREERERCGEKKEMGARLMCEMSVRYIKNIYRLSEGKQGTDGHYRNLFIYTGKLILN